MPPVRRDAAELLKEMEDKKKGTTLDGINAIAARREARRKKADNVKKEREDEIKLNEEMGIFGDVDFIKMIREYRGHYKIEAQPHGAADSSRITVCIRKRPLSDREIEAAEIDVLTCANPQCVIHDCKVRVDGYTKYLDNYLFKFDHVFDETNTTQDIYTTAAFPLVQFVVNGGIATAFAYGQTGSGKTFTMTGIQEAAAFDMFSMLNNNPNLENIVVGISFFEIYGGRCQDLLNNRQRLELREDKDGNVNVVGLEEVGVGDAEELLEMMKIGNRYRSTTKTDANDVSSRSHAICQMILRNEETLDVYGKFSIVDLAGSERGQDTKSHNRQLRTEGAEINKSLLALKECIRAIENKSTHVSFRSSKLTQILRESLTNEHTRTLMIAAVNPIQTSSDHTLNTLRYADRIKEQQAEGFVKKDDSPEEEDDDDEEEEDDEETEISPDDNDMKNEAEDEVEDIEYHKENDHHYHTKERLSFIVPKNRYVATMSSRVINDANEEREDREIWEKVHKTVDSLYDEERALLNLHTSVVQENAQMLVQEANLLKQVLGPDVIDYDIDAYTGALEKVLDKKAEMIDKLRTELAIFRQKLREEEEASKTLASVTTTKKLKK